MSGSHSQNQKPKPKPRQRASISRYNTVFQDKAAIHSRIRRTIHSASANYGPSLQLPAAAVSSCWSCLRLSEPEFYPHRLQHLATPHDPAIVWTSLFSDVCPLRPHGTWKAQERRSDVLAGLDQRRLLSPLPSSTGQYQPCPAESRAGKQDPWRFTKIQSRRPRRSQCHSQKPIIRS